jgi:hypothetical protein
LPGFRGEFPREANAVFTLLNIDPHGLQIVESILDLGGFCIRISSIFVTKTSADIASRAAAKLV